MPSVLLKLFGSKLFGPIASVLLIVSVIGNAVLGANLWAEKRHSGKLETRVEALAADNATLKSNNATLKAAIGIQNAGVDSIKTAADLAAANAKLGQAAHELAAASHDKRASALDAAKPAPGADLCTAASELIHNTLAGEHAK